ncbi:putative bifunctional diguanylate cyclase/phosphodiesterase [Shewanella cyperi]|uniref:putative bifunctional diguanylate cyclase/phosphodiesterase n=1 Tax=Shewanella cyperi TaxID=2814292 RepID=UPI001A9523F6|nr:bifunctional diguanylate cyclase/phosphodiesterase [Shewanella cyperi]QSX41310.1 bifunctional diguanylate cyclase/phosphodiesterase [Shewanella cyperi]
MAEVRPFLSLKWKLLLSVLSLMTVLTLSLGWFASRELSQQQGFLLESQQNGLQQNLNNVIHQAVDHAVDSVQQLVILYEQNEAIADMETHWADVQLRWGISALGILGRAGEPSYFLGAAPGASEKAWFERWSRASVPVWRIHCNSRCLLQVQVPILLNKQQVYFFIESELTSILANFRSQESFELAVLGSHSEHPIANAYWGRQLHSISNRSRSEPLLRQAAANWRWDEIVAGNSLYQIGDAPYAIWRFPLDQSVDGPALLVISNLVEWHQLLKQFQQSMLGLLLISLLLTALLLSMFAWSPIARLEGHVKALPLLAERRFDEVRHRLKPMHNWWQDEVDLLNGATLGLTDRLQSLEQDISDYTRELQRLAMLDGLTGLPNKAMLLHELNKAIACMGRQQDRVALLFLDLDEFKRVNDALGHDQGDELLKIIAERLTNSVRAMDTVFRQGGDEFLILLRGIGEEADVRRVIHKIFAGLQQPVVLGNHKLIITTSIGVAFCHSPSLRAEELIKHADLAMYQAKAAGRSNFRIFNEDMLLQANNRLMIEQDIGSAIAEHQLRLFLQPIVSIADGKLKGFEALLRWFHPKRGLIMPANFIPDIENSDAIIQVGNYVLAEAVQLLQRLKHKDWGELYIAVNLSARHYLAPGLAEYIRSLLLGNGISAKGLLLEVTEESVIEQVDKAMEVMAELKALGVRIAIDDFGTGYSSLSYLKQLPFDVLKIDRCFTSGIQENDADTHIVTTVIDLAHNLGRTVVAEGVESELQYEFLATAGCELAQGFLLAKPMDEHRIMSVLDSIHDSRRWPREDMPSLLAKLGT